MILLIVVLVFLGIALYRALSKDETKEEAYTTVAPVKNFPEVIGLPPRDAIAYLQSRFGDKYVVRTVGTYDESYRHDTSAIYLVIDQENTVTDAL